MEKSYHRFSELFAQLGLPSDEAGIRHFLVQHSPLPPDILLEDAPFWNEAQAALLREEKIEDADWAEVIDQLDNALRENLN
ncbi:hypothetical protein GCM10011450_03890 [Advenella faeciporci]|jgi:hypothetical protein|uniref:DUF2789 domain-containing protein n=2 Tax=Advenella TaxID=290425 RepID=A0A918JGG6_9BURK|nr:MULTISPECIES: DUF2789 domain-containing protein [Advenella]NLN67310.1 DUF2789 domain-containing protein [Alcaligenaceae bacterium]MBV4397199.1 DUF2789 domain-containing protein [Advenella alkanexedens]MDD3757726.1 DUF2789 domain-containing protein [Advenella sp.]NLY34700.1 DUF2789 domain-containing protein [Alcaligenaceae bacterium]WKU18270.1 DUF2789 domain-containing protein [Advenella alkanexedens]